MEIQNFGEKISLENKSKSKLNKKSKDLISTVKNKVFKEINLIRKECESKSKKIIIILLSTPKSRSKSKKKFKPI